LSAIRCRAGRARTFKVVDEEHLELVDAALAQLLDLLLGDLLVALQQTSPVFSSTTSRALIW